MNSKKLFAIALSAAMLAGCGGSGAGSAASGSSSEGKVYYLNFKPEVDAQWQELAKEYTEETGVSVTVLTAASDQYESTLKSEMGKKEAPTMFQVNGPVGLQSWKDYCYDLTGSDIVSELTSSEFELKNGDEIAGVGYVIESYGLIVNKDLLKKAGYTVDDIKSFDDLKKIAEDITKRKDELGFTAFTSSGMDGSSDWRFKTHLANLPIYYEYKADGIDDTDTIKGTYLDNYRKVWDLYINNGPCDPSQLASKTGTDAESEFAEGKAVFFQNGTWEYSAVSGLGDDNLAMLPIFFGVDDENEGICTGTENYWCVNKKASEADIKATLDFMNWVATSEKGVAAMTGGTGAMGDLDGMGFVTPFKSCPESENALVNSANAYGNTPVTWNFTTMPSENWKNDLGQALTVYAADQSDANWELVKTAFVDGWATEKALTK